MHLLKDHTFRTGIRFAPNDPNNVAFLASLKSGFDSAKKFLTSLPPSRLLPPSIHIPRSLEVDLDVENDALYMRPEKLPSIRVGQSLYISPFYILVDLNTLP